MFASGDAEPEQRFECSTGGLLSDWFLCIANVLLLALHVYTHWATSWASPPFWSLEGRQAEGSAPTLMRFANRLSPYLTNTQSEGRRAFI